MLKMRVSSPWGDVDINGYLENIEFCRKKAQYLMDKGDVKDVELMLKDIEAYDIILGTNSESIAFAFMREKEIMKKMGNRYRGNMSVILRMQAKKMM